ncbi:MAG: DUF1934 family protein [Clostridia bacterium]|nr:DUF1934 family protein [Clostridia bacterium]
MMNACVLKIITETNGEKNTVYKLGKAEFDRSFLKITYTDETSYVSIDLNGKKGKIVRQGEYSLELNLEEGKEIASSIGLGIASGEMDVYTSKMQWTKEDQKANLLLDYTLLFGTEKQNIKLTVDVQLKNNSEEK